MQVLQQLGVQRLVVGHTPQAKGRAATRCGGRLLLLDTGMSSGMMDAPAAAWMCHPGSAASYSSSSRGSSSSDSGSNIVSSSGTDDKSSSIAGSSSGTVLPPEADPGGTAHPKGTPVGAGQSSQTGLPSHSVVVYADGTVTAV